MSYTKCPNCGDYKTQRMRRNFLLKIFSFNLVKKYKCKICKHIFFDLA